MRIAIVHDWLQSYSGAERVLEQMLTVYPHADIYSLVDHLPTNERAFLKGKEPKTTYLQRAPFSRRFFRHYLFLFPHAIEQLDVRGYDIVISSSFSVAKGVRTGPEQLHICMCYSPPRYAWDMEDQYLAESRLPGFLKFMVKLALRRIRVWDVVTSNSVDSYIAISSFISKRILKYYRRESTILYPPVYIDQFCVAHEKESFYMTSSRLVPYKKIPTIAQAFSQMPKRELVVIGRGPDEKFVREIADSYPNVTYLGYQPNEILADYLRRARAFVFASEEDFGIAPLEAQACGTPVIAFSKGGVRETVVGLDCENPTGVFFDQQTPECIKNAVEEFERNSDRIIPAQCRLNAERFSAERFRVEFERFVSKAYLEFWQ